MLASARGGPIGALTEGAKKATEIALFKRAVPDAASGIVPGSVEAEINARYRAELKDSLSSPQVTRVAGERLLKDTLLKAGKDALNAEIAKRVYDPLGYQSQFREAGRALRRAPTPAAAQAYSRAHSRLARMLKRHTSLQAGYRYTPRNLLGSLLKDVSKTALGSKLDAAEREAWVEFFEKDLAARAQHAFYRVATDYYWRAYDAYNGLLQERTKLIAQGFEGSSGFKTTLRKPFPREVRPGERARLEIILTVVWSVVPRDPDLEVFVGGRQAVKKGHIALSRQAPKTVLVIFDLPVAPEGDLAIEIR